MLVGGPVGFAVGIGVGAVFASFTPEPSALTHGILAIHILALPCATWMAIRAWHGSALTYDRVNGVNPYLSAIVGSAFVLLMWRFFHWMGVRATIGHPDDWQAYYAAYFRWSTACLLACEGFVVGFLTPTVTQPRRAAARAQRSLQQVDVEIAACSRKLDSARSFREETKAVETRVAQLVSSDPANMELAARKLGDGLRSASDRDVESRLPQVAETASALASSLRDMEKRVETMRDARDKLRERGLLAASQVRQLAEKDPANAGVLIKRLEIWRGLTDDELMALKVASGIQAAYRQQLLSEREVVRSNQELEDAGARLRKAAAEARLLDLEHAILEREQARRAASLDINPSSLIQQLHELEKGKSALLADLAKLRRD